MSVKNLPGADAHARSGLARGAQGADVPSASHVNVRYFASLREALGGGERVAVAPGSTLGALRDQLLARGGRHADVLARGRAVRCALNQVLADESARLDDGAEVAFFPPVTGG